jgi:hypothetical protein
MPSCPALMASQGDPGGAAHKSQETRMTAPVTKGDESAVRDPETRISNSYERIYE